MTPELDLGQRRLVITNFCVLPHLSTSLYLFNNPDEHLAASGCLLQLAPQASNILLKVRVLLFQREQIFKDAPLQRALLVSLTAQAEWCLLVFLITVI